MLNKFTWYLGKVIGEAQADDIQDAVERAFLKLHETLTASGTLGHLTVASTSPASDSITIAAGKAVTPDNYHLEWLITQTIDVTYATAGSIGTTTPAAGQQKYVVVGAKHEYDDQQGGFDDNGALQYYKQAAQCEFEVWASAGELLGTAWVASVQFAAFLVSMRAANVEPLALAIREDGDGGVVLSTKVFDCSRWLWERDSHRAEHLDVRQALAYNSLPVIRSADGKITASFSNAIVTISGGEWTWLGWNSRRFAQVLRQRAIQIPATSLDFSSEGAGSWMVRLYLDEETGEPIIYYGSGTQSYPYDPEIGLASHSSQGDSNLAYPPTLIDMPLITLTTDAGGNVLTFTTLANTITSWIETYSSFAELTLKASNEAYPITLLHKAVGAFHPTRHPASANVVWNGGQAWVNNGVRSFLSGGGPIINARWGIVMKTDGTEDPILINLDAVGLPSNSYLPLASFVGFAGATQYQDMGAWGRAPYIDGFDFAIDNSSPSQLILQPGHFLRQGRVVPMPIPYTLALNDAGLVNYRDTDFALASNTWYYLYVTPITYYSLHGQGTAPAVGGPTGYPFLSLLPPDFSGCHPTWPWTQFIGAVRCKTAAFGDFWPMQKRRDFSTITAQHGTVAGIVPLDGAALAVSLSSAVPSTAVEAYIGYTLTTTNAYTFALGPNAYVTVTDYPFYYTRAALVSELYVDGLRITLDGSSSASRIHTVSTATAGNLTSLTLQIHGYWEDPLRPYHYNP